MPGLYMYMHIFRPDCISRKIVGKKYFPPPKKKLLGREIYVYKGRYLRQFIIEQR